MSYLRYVCLLALSGVQHILCFDYRRLVYPMLPVFSGLSDLHCPFGIL